MFLFIKHLETWLGTSLDRINERNTLIHFRLKKQSFSYYKQTKYKFLTDLSEIIRKWIYIYRLTNGLVITSHIKVHLQLS